MILFIGDNHFDQHPGRVVYEKIKDSYPIEFFEDDWSGFSRLNNKTSLLILNLMGDTCDLPYPGEEAQEAVKAYLERGGDFLLLHGASAAFHLQLWWRDVMGYRWVQEDDPDGAPPSTHPYEACQVRVCKNDHPLCERLVEMDLPVDEVYINLEKRAPAVDLMETTISVGTFVQAFASETPFGGRILGLMPGHKPEVTGSLAYITNVCCMIDFLLETAEG